MSIIFLDWCRLFIIAQAVFVLIATVIIWVKYTLRAIRSETNPRLWHIITISASYAGAIVFIAFAMMERFGQPMTWKLPAAGFVFVSGDFGLCFMLTHLYSHRIYAKAALERLAREEIEVTRANTKATEENTAAIEQPTRKQV